MVWTRDVTSWGGNWVTINIPFFFGKKNNRFCIVYGLRGFKEKSV